MNLRNLHLLTLPVLLHCKCASSVYHSFIKRICAIVSEMYIAAEVLYCFRGANGSVSHVFRDNPFVQENCAIYVNNHPI